MGRFFLFFFLMSISHNILELLIHQQVLSDDSRQELLLHSSSKPHVLLL
jgi:hypothetical protein